MADITIAVQISLTPATLALIERLLAPTHPSSPVSFSPVRPLKAVNAKAAAIGHPGFTLKQPPVRRHA